MKSYHLEEIRDAVSAAQMLSEALPEQSHPWVLLNPAGDDAIAYFNIDLGCHDDGMTGPYVVSADLSGRHSGTEQVVIEILQQLQRALGGTLRNDRDDVIP